MLLKPTTKTTLLGGSRLMSNFKSTGYKIKGGVEDGTDKKETVKQNNETQQTTEQTTETTQSEQQVETQNNTGQKTQTKQQAKTNKPSTVKTIFDNVLFYGCYGSLWMKDKSNVIKGGTQLTQEHQKGGGIIKDSLRIAAKIVLVFFMVIFISILIEEIVKIIKKYGPNLKKFNIGKCDCKKNKNKKTRKIKKQRRLIIAPIPCSEYVNSLNNQIKTQQQIQQQGIPQMQQSQQGITQTQQQVQEQMQQQVQEQVQQEQNLLQEASMINPLNSALRDDDLFKDRLELQGVRNMQVNTSDFL